MQIGCDIVENKRLKDIDQRFIDLVLTEKEKELYKTFGTNFLTGRFAAKEAIMKCLNNTKSLSFLDIEILKDKDGAPICNIESINISISHEKEYTFAVAIKKQ
ncbi:MAG: holo-ACP synthase [Erysipelotrichales bacterium]|nr:holo-ACP synthase [Erysipelotrichales bacterium]